MKKIFPLLSVIVSVLACSNLFALTCPNNGAILDTNYTFAQVVQLCGMPAATKTYQKIASLGEEWTYYKHGFGTNTQTTVTFKSGKLENINIVDAASHANLNCRVANQLAQSAPCPASTQTLSASGICGLMIQTGNNQDYVRSACGNPAQITVTTGAAAEIKELKYNGVGRTVLAFENDKLVDWKY